MARRVLFHGAMALRGFLVAEWFLFLLNVLDAGFTHFYIASGLATEANPLMARAWDFHPGMFFSVKAFLVIAGIAILHEYRRVRFAHTALALSMGAYAAVVCWHLIHLH